MAKKPDPLNALLAQSFTARPPAVAPDPAAPEVPAPAQPPAVSIEPDAKKDQPSPRGKGNPPDSNDRRASKAAPPEDLPPLDFDGVKKTTVSFYAAEQAQVDRILDVLLKARRHRGGFSDAIKIALRLCPMTADEIGRAWDTARAADKRTQKGKNS